MTTATRMTKSNRQNNNFACASCFFYVSVAALESRTWHLKEFRCYSQEKEKNFNRQIFSLSPNNL